MSPRNVLKPFLGKAPNASLCMKLTSDVPEFCCESQDKRVLTVDSCHSLVRIRKMTSHSKPFFMFDALLTVIFRIARYVNMFISDVWFIVVQCW